MHTHSHSMRGMGTQAKRVRGNVFRKVARLAHEADWDQGFVALHSPYRSPKSEAVIRTSEFTFTQEGYDPLELFSWAARVRECEEGTQSSYLLGFAYVNCGVRIEEDEGSISIVDIDPDDDEQEQVRLIDIIWSDSERSICFVSTDGESMMGTSSVEIDKLPTNKGDALSAPIESLNFEEEIEAEFDPSMDHDRVHSLAMRLLICSDEELQMVLQ